MVLGFKQGIAKSLLLVMSSVATSLLAFYFLGGESALALTEDSPLSNQNAIELLDCEGSYSQNFDSFLGTAETVPDGWEVITTTSFRGINNGSSSTGGVYAYGLDGEYSLGQLRSNSTGDIIFTANFVNATGATIEEITLSYDFEQWRFANIAGFVVTQSGLGNADVSSLSQNSNPTGTNGTVEVTPKSVTLTGLQWVADAEFSLTWTGTNPAGANSGFGIDNFTISYVCSSSENIISIVDCQAGYAENFDSYLGSAETLPTGFSTSFTGTNAPFLGTNTGSGSGGGFYAYGVSNEYALGQLRTNASGITSYTATFRNNSPSIINTMLIEYNFEQWRYGGNATGLVFSATGLGGADVSALSQAGLLSGTNGTVTTIPKSLLVEGLFIEPGQEFSFTWETDNLSGANNGVAVDDLSISFGCLTLGNGHNFLSCEELFENNFDDFLGTQATLPLEWTVEFEGSGSFQGINTGTSTAGGVYAYGANGEYSLGALRTNGTGDIILTATFTNNTGSLLSALAIQYDFEQWRYAGNTTGFAVSQNGLGAADVSGLSQNGLTSGINGTPTVIGKSIFIEDLAIEPGDEFSLVFTAFNEPGSNNGIAIDNFQITAFCELTDCPDLSMITDGVVVVDSECVDCLLSDGLIVNPSNNCPFGSNREFSVNDTLSWSIEIPLYSNDNSLTIYTRCVCELDTTVTSPVSEAVITNPGVCPPSCECNPDAGPDANGEVCNQAIFESTLVNLGEFVDEDLEGFFELVPGNSLSLLGSLVEVQGAIPGSYGFYFIVEEFEECRDTALITLEIKDCCASIAAPNTNSNPLILCLDSEGELSPSGGGIAFVPAASDLFFSQYIEGSGNNKALEIFNGTGESIDLSSYEVRTYFNGSPTPGQTFNLAGTLPNQAVYVIAHSSALPGITALANTLINGGIVNFNGDDAVALFKDNVLIDVIGNIGCDPGTGWVEGGNSTLNTTLVRQPFVFSGVEQAPDPTLPGCPFPTLGEEWFSLPTDDFTTLGAHTFMPLDLRADGYNFYENESLEVLLGSGDALSIACTSLGITSVFVTTFVEDLSGNQVCESLPVMYQFSCEEGPELILTAITESCPGTNEGIIEVVLLEGEIVSFEWSTNNGSGLDNSQLNQSGLSPGVYQLLVFGENGCASSYSATLMAGVDSNAPAIVCPPNRTIGCLEETSPLLNPILGFATATDDCSSTIDIVFTDNFVVGDVCESGGVIERTWMATDESNNSIACVQLITIDPSAVVEVLGCTELELEIGPGEIIFLSPSDFNATGLGGCQTPTLSISPTQVSVEDAGEVMVTIRAEDECGNVGTCVVLLNLLRKCEVVVPNDIVVDLDPGLCGKVVSYSVGLIGNCPEVTDIIQSDFTAPYSQSEGITINQTFPDPSITVDGVVFDNAPASIRLFTPNPNQFPVPPNNWYLLQFVQWEVVQGGTVSFDWLYEYENGDGFPGTNFAPAGFYVGPQIVQTTPLAQVISQQLSVNGNPNVNPALWNQTGTRTLNVSAGQWFGFWVRSIFPFSDWCALTIDNFQISGLVDNFPVLISGPDSGEYLEVGSYESCWGVFNDDGELLDEKCFNIDILPYSGPVNPNLSCNNMTNVSLGFVNGECRTVLSADDILEGGPYRCYEDYIVQITYPQIPGINSYAEGNILDYSHVGLTLTVMVTDPVTGNRCWGQIRVEDKQAPLLDCGDELTFPCTSGYAENRDPRGNRIVFPSGLFWGSPANSPIRVTPQLFLNDAINNRRFLVEAGVIDCSQVVLTYSDQEILLGCSGEGGIWRRVIRTWVATDAYHNTSTCQQILNFERLTLQQAIAESGVTAGILNLQPCTPGFALPDYNLQGACNVWAGIKSELQMPLCGNSTHSYKLFRTYKFFDDCTGQSQDVEQIIVVKDEIAPVFTACQNGLLPQRTLNTNTFSCKADVVLTLPAVTDNCSSALTVVPSVAGAQLLNIGGTWTATFDVGGPYQVTWTATDECGNQSQCIERIFVEDKRPPVAVCISNTTVTLTEGGEARVYATSIDNGSWDNCGIFDYKVMRMSNTTRSFCGQSHNTSENPALGSTFNPAQPNAPYWRDFVSFCCADLEATEPIMVVLRVRDIYGNVNYCMVNVEVQTKIPPVITAPAAVTIECRDFQSELEFQADLLNRERSLAKGYGWATVSSICNEEPRVSVSINLTDCGVTQFPGNRVVRRFTVGTGVNTRTADQEFFVVNSTPFRILSTPTIHNSIDDVVWPIDLELPTCNDAFDVEALKVRYNETTKTFFDFSEPALATRPRSMPFLRPVACSTPGMGHEDHVFELEGGCLKIVREWKVIDWCQANTLQNPWTYTQVIKVMDSAPAEFVSVSINLTSGQSQTVNGCPTGLISLAHTADNCAPGLSFSLVTSDDCAKLQKIAYGYRLIVGNNANSFVPTATQLTGSGLATAEGVIGWNFGAFAPQFQGVVHRMIWTLDDKCGNISTCQFDFIIRDGKKPSPICTDEIIAVLMQVQAI
jgi:hypothetical protein